jgi:hypothetical protein
MHPTFINFRNAFYKPYLDLVNPLKKIKHDIFYHNTLKPLLVQPSGFKRPKNRKFTKRALFLLLITKLSKQIRVTPQVPKYSTLSMRYARLRLDGSRKRSLKSHLLPRQAVFLNSPEVLNFKGSQATHSNLLRRVAMTYSSRGPRRFSIRAFDSRVRPAPFFYKRYSRTLP